MSPAPPKQKGIEPKRRDKRHKRSTNIPQTKALGLNFDVGSVGSLDLANVPL